MRLKNKLFLGLLALFLAGCSEHDWVDTVSDKPVKVTAQIAKGRVGFSEMDSITYAYWENDDVITLSTPLQGNLDYAASMSAEGTGLVTFSPKGDYLKAIDGEKVFACYPASTITEGKVYLPVTDVWTDDNPLPFAYAVSSIKDSEVSLDFKHVFSFLKLTVTPSMLSDTTKAIRHLIVQTSSNEPLSVGEGSTFDYSTLSTNIAKGTKSVRMETNTRVVNSKWDVYIPILPQPADAVINIALLSEVGDTLYTLTKETPATGLKKGNIYRIGTSISYDTSYLIDGPTFNASIKELANGMVAGRGTYDSGNLIAKIKFLTEVTSLPENYITVSAEDSPAPIYASFNATDSLLTVFTPAKDIEVVNASNMFSLLSCLHTIDFGKFDVNEKTTNTLDMFYYCSSLTTLDVSNWNTSNVTNMQAMFSSCSALTTLDVSNWNTSNVTDMGWMFMDCSVMPTLNVLNWDTRNVTNMQAMFYGCSALTTLGISKWNTDNVINMGGMFYNCPILKSLDITNWNTSSVTNMQAMFAECSALMTLDISKWKTNNVISMREMFHGCISLTTLDLSNWSIEKLTDMNYMFLECFSLETLYLTNWNTENVTNMTNIFSECQSLVTLDISNWSINESANLGAMFKNCASTSQACEITATQETQEYLLSKTGTTGMNPAWFIWTNGKTEGGSSVENMPNQGW